MRPIYRVVFIGALVTLFACAKSTTSPSSNAGTTGGNTSSNCTAAALGNPALAIARGTMTVQINGVPWTAVCAGVLTSSNVISISGMDSFTNTSQTIGFASQRATGTYTIGPLSALNASLAAAVSGSAAVWRADLANGAGAVVLTTVTGNAVAGTFTFTMLPAAGSTATGTKVLTNGVVNLTF